MTDEVVRMLDFDPIGTDRFFRKVFEVVGDDDPSLAPNRYSQDVSIVTVGQHYPLIRFSYEVTRQSGTAWFIKSRVFELRLAEVLALLQESADPLVVDPICPTSTERIGESQP